MKFLKAIFIFCIYLALIVGTTLAGYFAEKYIGRQTILTISILFFLVVMPIGLIYASISERK